MEDNSGNNTPVIGMVVWFRPWQFDEVRSTINDLKRLGIKHLRTGISWADWHMEGIKEWYDWLIPELAKHVIVLPCFLYTPPSIGKAPKTSSPPRDPKDYADFIDIMITLYDDYFDWVELWNEPNNIIEYDFTMDYSWNTFAEMIGMAAYWAKQKGKNTLLGGMSPIDPNWLQLMIDKGVIQYIDAIGVHGFPGVFDQQWSSWNYNLTAVRDVLKKNGLAREIWITEAGFSTWQHDEVRQLKEFQEAISANAQRVYWYGLNDLDFRYATVGGFHLDDREYYFGMKGDGGREKLLYKLLAKYGMKKIKTHEYIQKQYSLAPDENYILITGGAGFIGTNLAKRLLEEGKRVMIYDNLSRPGVELNLQWLKNQYGNNLIVQVADIREAQILEECVKHAEQVFHFSAQVAVTSSLVNPEHDLEVNIKGTFNLLEAIRKSTRKPALIFTSTNKVYGDLADLGLVAYGTRYRPSSKTLDENGIDETRSLDFHSPYGCSKGAADQYVLDYSRSYGLDAAVFRMSCVYGPHQFGNEDQGWVAHFLIAALENKSLVIYGDGKQVRDILFVEDLIDAFLLAQQNMDKVRGHAFNIGGGPGNAVSLIEVLDVIKKHTGKNLDISFDQWRTGDQQYYVSNTSKFNMATGWKPKHTVSDGIGKLTAWLREAKGIQIKQGKEVLTKAIIS